MSIWKSLEKRFKMDRNSKMCRYWCNFNFYIMKSWISVLISLSLPGICVSINYNSNSILILSHNISKQLKSYTNHAWVSQCLAERQSFSDFVKRQKHWKGAIVKHLFADSRVYPTCFENFHYHKQQIE
jgi:hypothetical protein